jgi:pilus assembly protein CpaE
VRNPRLLVFDKGEAFAEQVQRASALVRPRPEVVACTNTGSIGDVIESEGPFDVVVAGPGAATPSGLTRLQLIRTQMPGMNVILSFAERPKANLRDIIRAGAVDLLLLPVDDQALADTIKRATDMSLLNAPETPASGTRSSPARLGSVYTVASASGGSGKTFYATNLAYFLQQQAGGTACLLDLDLEFGEVSTTLRLRPRYTLSDILDRDETDEGELERHIDEYVVRHDTGIHVLAAPKNPADADRIQPSDVLRVIEALRCRFDHVIVDTPAALTETVLTAFEISDQVHVVATLDVPSLRNMNVFLKTLEDLNVPTDNVRLVLNKAERGLGIDVEQLSKLFPQGFLVELPYAREVTRSLNLGTPILAYQPQADVSQRLAAGLAPLVPDQSRGSHAPSNGEANGRSVIGRLLRRSSAVQSASS